MPKLKTIKTPYKPLKTNKEALEIIDFLITLSEDLFLKALKYLNLTKDFDFKNLEFHFENQVYVKVLGIRSFVEVLKEALRVYQKQEVKTFKEVAPRLLIDNFKLNKNQEYEFNLPRYLTSGEIFEDLSVSYEIKEFLRSKNLSVIKPLTLKPEGFLKDSEVISFEVIRDYEKPLEVKSLLKGYGVSDDVVIENINGNKSFKYGITYGVKKNKNLNDPLRVLSLAFGVDYTVIGYLNTGKAFKINSYPILDLIKSHDNLEYGLVDSSLNEEILNHKLRDLYYEFKVSLHEFYLNVCSKILSFCRENYVDLLVFGLKEGSIYQLPINLSLKAKFYLENMQLNELLKLLRLEAMEAGFSCDGLKNFHDALLFHEENNLYDALEIYDLYVKENKDKANLLKSNQKLSLPKEIEMDGDLNVRL